jgi:hypothetical protein
MSEGSSKITTVKVKEKSFIRDKGELSNLLKFLSKVSASAVEILVDAMNAKDGVDQKTKIACAEKLLDFQIACAKQVNDDNMQRMIAEIKLNRTPLANNLSAIEFDEEKRRNRPVVDFSQIQDV